MVYYIREKAVNVRLEPNGKRYILGMMRSMHWQKPRSYSMQFDDDSDFHPNENPLFLTKFIAWFN